MKQSKKVRTITSNPGGEGRIALPTIFVGREEPGTARKIETSEVIL
jgi:hypothetical protein